ncbi:MAG: sensor domain-containing diguanylate cyclase [Actinomycetota bacterium]
MDPVQILQSLRSAVVVVATDGTVLDAYGSITGPLGRTREEVIGTNMLEHIAPEAIPEMLEIMDGSAGRQVRHHPLPFTVPLLHREGHTLPADALATGIDQAWVVQLTPRTLNPNALDLIDLVLDGVELPAIAAAIVERHLSLAHTVDGRHSCHVVLDVGTPGAHIRSGGDGADRIDEAILAIARTADSPLLASFDGGDGLMGPVDGLPPSVAAVAEACGYQATVVAVVGDPDSSRWVLIWLYGDEAVGHMGRGSSVSRHSLLRVVRAALSRKRFEELMVTAARTDPLTRLVNRRGFEEALSTVAAEDEAAVLYMDLDRFKSINDKYGHPVGDAVLVEVARRIERSCRAGDVVARLGGDEFAVLVTGPGAVSTGHVVARIEQAVGRMLEGQIGPPSVGVTIGVATTVETPVEQLVATADERLLERKRARPADARSAR